MRPTSLRVLAALTAATGVLAWVVTWLLDRRNGTPPAVPWTAPGALFLLTVGVLATALALRARLAGAPGTRPVNPFLAARMAVLAMASSRVGAIVTGLYAGYAGYLLPDLDREFRRAHAIIAGWAVLAGVLLVAAALFLERVCRIKGPPEDDAAPAGGG